MTTVTRNDIADAVKRLGVMPDDSVIVHSSLKSLGYVEGGANAVIDGLLDALCDGTLIFPTLCQRDWEHVYENWNMDVDSDVGYITNVFRKRDGALRSNQATHSVAAIGKDAKFFTETHGITGKRIGIFGDTPFAEDSPWEKMYQQNTKAIMIGVNMESCTFRHYAEYVYVNRVLDKLCDSPEHAKMREHVWLYGGKSGAWPCIESVPLTEAMSERGLVTTTTCGDAALICVSCRDFVDACIDAMENVREEYILDYNKSYNDERHDVYGWLRKARNVLLESK